MLKDYKIIHRETTVGWYCVQAENKEDALEEFYRQVDNNQIDFSDQELIDSSEDVETCDENCK